MVRKVAVFGLALLIMMLAALPAGAQGTAGKPFPPEENTDWGEPVALGNGEVKTFVTTDGSGKPELVGLYLTASALTDLPTGMGDGKWDVLDAEGKVVFPCCGYEFKLEFPESISATPIKYLILNWNPMGHTPAHVYDVPHFDVHYYLISDEERSAIAPATGDTMCMVPNPPGSPEGEHPVSVDCDTFETAMMPLPEGQMPTGYVSVGAVEPAMGNHLLDPTAPELNGENFTYTWIYGAYDGKLTFLEPMIANSFLEEKNPEVCASFPLPEEMAEPGYYPSSYCIRYMEDEAGEGVYAVTLEAFQEF